MGGSFVHSVELSVTIQPELVFRIHVIGALARFKTTPSSSVEEIMVDSSYVIMHISLRNNKM